MSIQDGSTPPSAVASDSEKTATDRLVKRYETEIDLYKFYLDTSVKGSLFAFGLTGALLSYYFTNYENNSSLVWSLPLPILLNSGFFVLFRASIRASTQMMLDHEETCRKLDHVKPFDTNPLPAVCRILASMYGLVAAGLTIVFVIHAVDFFRNAV